MKRSRTGAALPAACLLAALAAAAAAEAPPAIPPPPARQEPIGQINGTVFDADRKGVVGLPVALIPQAGFTIHGTSTDNGGRYAFKGLETGTYNVVVTLPAGGVLRKDGIRIRPLFRSIVDFTLATDTPQASPPPVGGTAGGAAASAPAEGAKETAGGTATSPPAEGAKGTAGGAAASPPAEGAQGTADGTAADTPAEGAQGTASGTAADAPAEGAQGTTGGTAPGAGSETGAPPAPALSAIMLAVDRSPVPDALLTLTPVEGRGRFQRSRTGADGSCSVDDLTPGVYRITARAPGFLTWSLGPIPLEGSGPLKVSLGLVPYPMGFPGTIEDLLIPAEPIPPAAANGD